MCCKVENIAPSFDGIEHLQARPRGYAPAFPGVVCFDVVFFHAEKGRLHARKADAATSIAGSLHGRNMICIAQKGAGEGFSRKRSFRAAKPPGAGDDAGRRCAAPHVAFAKVKRAVSCALLHRGREGRKGLFWY